MSNNNSDLTVYCSISADGSTQQTQSQSMSVSKSVASANNTESSQGATTTSSLSAYVSTSNCILNNPMAQNVLLTIYRLL